jgi:hypothetical protein
MRLLILSITILACWAGEAEAVKLPADVQTVIDKAGAAETAAQNEADAKILKVKQAMIKDLTKLQESYTKKGNLDAANGIKAKIDDVSKSMPDLLSTVEIKGLDKITKRGCLGSDTKPAGQTIKGDGPLLGFDVGYSASDRQITCVIPIYTAGRGQKYGNGQKDATLTGNGPVIAIIGAPGKDGLLGGIQIVTLSPDGKTQTSKWIGIQVDDSDKQMIYKNNRPITTLNIGAGDRIDTIKE